MRHLRWFASGLVLAATACASTAPVEDAGPPPPTTALPAATTAAPATAPPPVATAAPVTTAPVTTAPAGTVTTAPSQHFLFDYPSLGEAGAVVDTPLGPMSWLDSGSVPKQWLDLGFPPPTPGPPSADNGLDEETTELATETAPCCLVFYPVASGLIGLGSTDAGGDDHPSSSREARDLGLDCGEAPWFSRMDEVWFTADGVTWTRTADEAFSPYTLSACDYWLQVVEHDGRWLIVAPASATPDAPSAATTAAFTSADLETWEPVDLGLGDDGMHTAVDSVATAGGRWLIAGTRISDEPGERSESGIPLAPYDMEWAGWMSADGRTYEPVDLAALFGPPWCAPLQPHPCAALYAYGLPDALVVYVHQYGDPVDDRDISGWRLWIGLFAPGGA